MTFSKCEEVLQYLIASGELNQHSLTFDTINFLEGAVRNLQFICGRIQPRVHLEEYNEEGEEIPPEFESYESSDLGLMHSSMIEKEFS